MSNKPLVWALVAAVLLAGLTLVVVVSRRGGSTPATANGVTLRVGDALLDLQTIDVRELSVGANDVGRDVVERDERGSSVWTLRPRGLDSSATGGVRWSVDSTPVEQALLALRQARVVGEGTAPEGGEAGAWARAGVRVRTFDGREQSVEFGATPLGGRDLVRVRDGTGAWRWAVVDLSLRERLLGKGFGSEVVRGWRSKLLIPDAPEASRVRVGVEGSPGLGLRRVGRLWRVEEPVSAPADAESVARLLGALTQLRIERFYDEGAPTREAAGLGEGDADGGVLTLRVERDERVVDGERVSTRTRARTVRIGGPADATGRTAFALVETGAEARGTTGEGAAAQGGGGAVVSVDGAGLAILRVDPLRYVSRTSSEALASDVQRVRVIAAGESGGATTIFARVGEAWEERRSAGGAGGAGDAAPVRLSPREGGEVGLLLEFLTREPAKVVRAGRPEGAKLIGRVELLDLAGERMGEALEVAVIIGDANPLLLGAGEVWRSYNAAPALLQRALGGASAGGAAAKPPTTDAPAPGAGEPPSK
jgi:hypothetical protein